MRKVYSLFLFILLTAGSALAQDGTLVITVVDANSDNDAIIGAVVTVSQNNNYVASNATDISGLTKISGLDVGVYDVKVEYVGQVKDIQVRVSEGINRKEVVLGAIEKEVLIIEAEPDDLVEDGYGGGVSLGGDAVQGTNRSLNQAISMIGGASAIDGGTPSIRGGRTSGNLTLVDGIPVRGSVAMPPSAYGDVQVYASGVPAEYGDATSGIVSITTAGISVNRRTSVELIQSFEGFGYSTLELFTTGPLIKKEDTTIKLKDKKIYKAKLGYMLAGTANYRKDPDPSAIGVWVVNDDALGRVQDAPLRPSPLGSGFVSKSAFLSKDDMTLQKVKPNTSTFRVNLNGKLDWRVSDNVQFTLGGRMNNFRGNDYIYTYSLLNSANNSQFTNETYSGYARIRHRFKSDSSSLVQNANYMIQFDYTHFQNKRFDPTHGEDIFKYGHVGKFDIYRQDYQWQSRELTDPSDSSLSYNVFALYQLETPFDTLIRFRQGDQNSVSSNYTRQYFDFANNNVRSLTSIVQNGGLINGMTPNNVYSLWSDVGTPYTGFGRSSEDQTSLQIKLGGEIGAHTIKTGFRYESRVSRSYSLGAAGLWGTMRQSVNRHLALNAGSLDSGIFVFSDGNYYGVDLHKAQGTFLDTVKFDRQTGSVQTSFDKNFREYLIGQKATDLYGRRIDENSFLNPDAYDPSTFDISWFSANDLLENRVVNYYGYDHTGKKTKGRPSLDDFLNNEADREIAPYNPIYMAWFLQDEVIFKDLSLRVGVRVDRFDANQWVLEDEYSLYPIKTVSEVSSNTDLLSSESLPSTIGDEFKVYVDDPYNPNAVLGFRDENRWYDAEGNRINDPQSIAELSNSGTIAPYTNFKSRNEENEVGLTSESFKDYEPQWTIMPRVAVSFPISKTAMFFANYDVLAQRPTSGNLATIDDYYFLTQRPTGTVANPNLKPEKTISYEVGFQQAVAKNMAVKFQTYYRELRDMIQVVPVRYAYPIDYTSFGNIDFGTVKGFIFGYELVPYGANKNVTLNANYTLQFAKATGSGSGSQAALVAAGQPNLRTIQPTGSDIRHNFAASFDFRYSANPAKYNGPRTKGGRPLFLATGANLILNGTSGRPYSGQTNPTQAVAVGVAQRATIDGSINGNRYPWIFRMDLKVDKTFPLVLGAKFDDEGKHQPGTGKMVGINAYVWVQNLFDARNVVGVYRYTGLPDDDGWLSSAEGQQTSLATAFDQQSYVDMYNIKVNNPSNYSLPRLIRFGLAFQF